MINLTMTFVALRMLIGDRAKYLGLIIGIAFSTVLMAQQVSIFLGILNRTSSQITDIYEPDLWIMNPLIQYIDENRPMPDREIHRIKSIQGIQWTAPFYKGGSLAKTDQGLLKQIIILGVDDETLICQPQRMIHGEWTSLKEPLSIIMDYAGWDFIWPGQPFEYGRELELNDRRFRIVGICEASPPFQTFPVAFMRYTETSKLGIPGKNFLSFVLAKLEPGANIQTVKQEIQKKTGLRALTKEEFRWKSINYYLTKTGIPISFGITVTLGFLVGALVAGLTFYMFVMENLKQFGALKAIGVSNYQLLGMVICQAIVVALLGFFIGIGLAAIFFKFMGQTQTFRGFELYWQVVLFCAFAVFGIVLMSSFGSIRKVLVLDPAIVFRG